MVLHYGMGSQDKNSDASSHTGSKLTTKLITIVICAVLFAITLFGWIYVGVSVWSTSMWSQFTNAGAFAFWHDMATLRFIDYMLYGTCALVQAIKVVDFWTHYKNLKNGSSEAGIDKANLQKKHATLALINVVISGLACLLIVLDIILLSRYHYIGNYFFNLYFILMVFVQIPMLHYMIVKQENSQQSISGGRAESWVVKDYDNALRDTVNE